MSGNRVRSNYGRASVQGALPETVYGPRRLIFVEDDDSDGFSIEVYERDDRPQLDYVGRIDLFANQLILGGKAPITLPKFTDRKACEAWVTEQVQR